MNYIRLKSNIQERSLQDRLQYNPEILELHLEESDLDDPAYLISVIQMLKNKGVKPYLHHPMRTKGVVLDILSKDERIQAFYHKSTRQLVEICKQEGIKCVIHAHYAGSESSSGVGRDKTIQMRNEIEKILEYGREVLLWEDTIKGIFAYSNPYLIPDLILPLNLPLIVDISHSFIALRGDNEKLIEVMKQTEKYAEYFHVVDSKGQVHDGLVLGKGKIDWERVKPYIHNKPFIFEIALEPPYENCTPMVKSAEYYLSV